MNTKGAVWKCWNCDKVGHLAKDCWKPKKESMGRTCQKPPSAKMVHSVEDGTQLAVTDDLMDYLLSDSDKCEVRQIHVQDQGSVHQQARVTVGGVTMLGMHGGYRWWCDHHGCMVACSSGLLLPPSGIREISNLLTRHHITMTMSCFDWTGCWIL